MIIMKNIILLGGSGYIGTHLAEQWLQQEPDMQIFSISRHGRPEKLVASLEDEKRVKWIAADLFNVDSYFVQLPKQADAIVDLVGTATAKTASEFEKLNVEPVKIMIELMERLAIPKGCYISGLIGMPGTGQLFTASKQKGEAIAKTSGKDIGIVKPSLVYGDRSDGALMVPLVKMMGLFKKELKPIKVQQLSQQIIQICQLTK